MAAFIRARAEDMAKGLLDLFLASETAVLVTLAVITGLGSGFSAVIFWRLILFFHNFSFGTLGNLLSFMGRYYVILVPALGGLLVGPMVYRLAQEAKGHGVPEVMEAVALKGGRIRPIVAVVKSIASSISIGTGGSAGREGPIVQISAGLGSTLGQLLKLSDERVKNLVACGSAAGIAATFNAPIAGVLFALEIIMGEFSVRHLSSVVIASVTASVIGRIYLGDHPAFLMPPYSLASHWELFLYALLGLVTALAGLALTKLLYFVEDIFDSWNILNDLKPAIGGLLLGVVGLFFPEIFGTGHDVIEAALHNQLAFKTLVLLGIFKIVAMALTLGSGGSGGVFAPSMFTGAMVGGAFGYLMYYIAPFKVALPGAYAMVGMAAVFSAAARAPLTSIVIVFEMTRDYRIILPLMLATMIATVVAWLIDKESIYTLKLTRRGINIHARKDINLMRAIKVEEAMTPLSRLITVTPDMPLRDLARLFEATHHHGFVVVDSRGELCGVVTLSDLERAVNSGQLDGKVADICTTNVRVVFPDETLEDALRHFGALDVGRIPVVSRSNPKRLVGLLRRSDIIQAYARASLKLQEQRHRMELLRLKEAVGKLMEFEIREGDAAAGKRIRELNLPPDCLVVAIRRGGSLVVPRGNTILMAGDKVEVLADETDEDTLRRIFRFGPSEEKPEEVEY